MTQGMVPNTYDQSSFLYWIDKNYRENMIKDECSTNITERLVLIWQVLVLGKTTVGCVSIRAHATEAYCNIGTL